MMWERTNDPPSRAPSATGFPSRLAPTGFPSPSRRRRATKPWGGVRGGGNHDLRCSGFPPTLSLPHIFRARLRRDGGGDVVALSSLKFDRRFPRGLACSPFGASGGWV